MQNVLLRNRPYFATFVGLAKIISLFCKRLATFCTFLSSYYKTPINNHFL